MNDQQEITNDQEVIPDLELGEIMQLDELEDLMNQENRSKIPLKMRACSKEEQTSESMPRI